MPAEAVADALGSKEAVWLDYVHGHAASASASRRSTVDALYLLTHGGLTLGAYLGSFLLPGFLGNAIGGVSLVAVLNHAQVAAGLTRRPRA